MTSAEVQQLSDQASALLDAGRTLEAKAVYNQICSLDPDDADAHLMLAAIDGEMGSLASATRHIDAAIRSDPGIAEAYIIKARLMTAGNDLAGAEDSLSKAVELDPGDAECWTELAGIQGRRSRFEAASVSSRRALEITPDSVEAHTNLANALRETEDFAGAIEHYRRVTELNPRAGDAFAGQGFCAAKLERYAEAVTSYRRAGELKRNDEAVLAGLGAVLSLNGQHQEAYELLYPIVKRGARVPEAIATFADTVPYCEQSADAIPLLEQLVDSGRLDAAQTPQVLLSLGNLYETQERFDEAFERFSAANALRWKAAPYDLDVHTKMLAAIVSVYSRENMAHLPATGNSSESPVFIVGMPRSGTTLVEQILCTHPQVFGAGELEDLSSARTALPPTPDEGLQFPFSAATASVEALSGIADGYLRKTAELAGDCIRVTDKMPHNFLILGFIQQLFPRARIIHVSRDPLDTCFSCYTSAFLETHSYTYDLNTMGRYYHLYRQMMAHWDSVLSLPVLNVTYENLVDDLEGVSRNMIEFCGLEWDDSCLKYYTNPRVVRTPSRHQVTRPIYTTSVGRAQRFIQHLAPLQRGLEGEADA